MGTTNRLTVWIAGDVLTAAALNGEFNNIITTLNGNVNADNIDLTDDYAFTGALHWSGVTNITSTFPTWTSNLGLARATTTDTGDSIRVLSRDGSTALSSTAPAYIVMPSTATAGALLIFTVTANVTIKLTGATWGFAGLGDLTGMYFRVLAINDNATLRWGVALLGGRTTLLTTDTNATQASVNLPEEVLCNAAVGSASNRCREVGYFRADFDDTGGASEDLWTLQSGINDIVVGQSPDGLWSPWIPGYTGFSANPTAAAALWTQIGRVIFVSYNATAGTSNSTSYTTTQLPAKALSNDAYGACGVSVNNSAGTATAQWSTASGSQVLTMYNAASNTGWTAAGTKLARFLCIYPVGPVASFID